MHTYRLTTLLGIVTALTTWLSVSAFAADPATISHAITFSGSHEQ